MTCPHYRDQDEDETTALCMAIIVPFAPSASERSDSCTTGLHTSCPLYRSAGRDLSLAIHHEVARAIG